MTRTKLLLAALALIAASVCAGWWFGNARVQTERPDALTATLEKGATAGTVTDPAMPRPSMPARSGTSRTPIETVPDDTPALELLARLDAPARQGDAAAACRLGSALLHCIRINGVMPGGFRIDPETIASAPEDQQATLVNAAANMQERLERMGTACAGISRDTHQGLALHYLLSAAQGGNTAARARFVKASPTVTDVLQFPEIGALYTANAPRLFDAMWREGDPQAIEVLRSFGGATTPEARQAPWLAIPPELRDRQLASELWRLRVRATTPAQQAHIALPRLPSEPVPDPATVATAQRLWDERFENSPGIEAMRMEHESQLTRLQKAQEPPRRRSLFPDEC
jgi:hypothetical protein